MQATLNASNFNGYNIACFGQQNGTLSVSVTGGTPPYRYEWSNGDSVATLNNLAAGYYFVRVSDSSSQVVETFITITQPEPLQAEKPEPFVYGNDYNISSFGACNGMAPVVVTGG
ncbi:MAG TPA: SprB repeat-containing protein, partial [Bacteroidia bacterium]|nr:SprB repeat-containing protein [Bacteroidia bacterium]